MRKVCSKNYNKEPAEELFELQPEYKFGQNDQNETLLFVVIQNPPFRLFL